MSSNCVVAAPLIDDLPTAGVLARLGSTLAVANPGDRFAVLRRPRRIQEVKTARPPDGDRLLREIGPRLAPLLRTTDVLARLGGDEFG